MAVCCELLSNYCIFDIIDNLLQASLMPTQVVNCFQIIVSLTLLTTRGSFPRNPLQLWIAFKLLYLWHYWQLTVFNIGLQICCELLSNYCIFDIIDNYSISATAEGVLWIAFKLLYLWHYWQPSNVRNLLPEVVNCFQIIVSLTLLTTAECESRDRIWLWIAFKLLYLWHYWQHLF